MPNPSLPIALIKQASDFGIRFTWDNNEVVKASSIENIRNEDACHYFVFSEDQNLFHEFSKIFYNTYREVTLFGFSVYIRKTVKVGDLVQVGNDLSYLIEDNKLVPANSNHLNSTQVKQMFNLLYNDIEAKKHLTKAFYN